MTFSFFFSLWLAAASTVDSSSIRISSGSPHVEPTIAAHPTDPKRLIVTASEVIDGTAIIAKSFVTDDSGKTWRAVDLPQMQRMVGDGTLVHALDNWVTYSDSGTAYLSTLVWTEEEEKRLPIFVYRSADDAKNWTGPVVIPSKTFDRPAIAASGDHVAIAAAVSGRDTGVSGAEGAGFALYHSSTGGKSFDFRHYIAKDDLGHNSMNPLFLSDGALIVPFVDYPGNDGQALRSSRIYVARFADHGGRYVSSSLVADVPRAFPGHASVARDAKTKRIYAAWNGGTADRRDIRIAFSADDGRTWAGERAISDPVSMRPAIAVNRFGDVAVVLVRQEPQEGKVCWRPYITHSRDRGATFSTPRALTAFVSCSDTPANRATRVAATSESVADRWEDGGDYIGIAADADGAFHPVWSETSSGAFQGHTTTVKLPVSDQSEVDRFEYGASAVADAEFREHAGDVILRGSFGDMQQIADLPVAVAAGEQTEDRLLAIGQIFRKR